MRKRNTKRGFAAVVAMLIVVAMLLTGTFAWQSISQQALNQAVARPWVAGGRLHDDFEHLGSNFGENQWLAGTTANKDVFVENFSDRIDPDGVQPGQDIFVRVRLHEFLQFGEGASSHPTQDGVTWPAEQAGVTTITGTFDPVRNDVTTWSFRTPTGNASGAPEFEHYWTWTFGQEGEQKWYMPTFNIDPDSRASDVSGAAVDPQAHLDANPNPTAANPNANITDAGDVATYRTGGYPLEAGNEGFWQEGDTWNAVQKVEGGNVTPNTVEQETRQTQALAFPVITMTQWLNGDDALGLEPHTSGDFWVWDYDGWFYWANPLPAGEATGLLLSSITLNETPNDEMYYAIFVDAEMATANYWQTSFTNVDEMTSGAAILMNQIARTDATGDGGGGVGTAEPLRTIIRETEIGDTFEAGDITWRVLAEEGDYRLLMTEHVHGRPSLNTVNEFVPFSQSLLHTHMTAWGEANMTPQMRVISRVPVNVDVDVRLEVGPAAPGQNSNLAGEHGPAGFTSPGAALTPNNAPTGLFALSTTEVNEYIVPSNDVFLGPEANAARRATDYVTGGDFQWWMRSPGANETSPARIIDTTGAPSGASATATGVAMRPALWVWVG